MKNHLEPITKRAVTDYGQSPGNKKLSASAAASARNNYTNTDCGCTGKCDC